VINLIEYDTIKEVILYSKTNNNIWLIQHNIAIDYLTTDKTKVKDTTEFLTLIRGFITGEKRILNPKNRFSIPIEYKQEIINALQEI
jgi:hypothetical protein